MLMADKDRKLVHPLELQGVKYPVEDRPTPDLLICKKKVFTEDEVISILTELQKEIEKLEPPKSYQNEYTNAYLGAMAMKEKDKYIIQQKINELNGVCDDK